MSQLGLVVLLCLLKLITGLTETEEACMADNAGTLDNKFLLGQWFHVYKFSMWLNLPASTACHSTNITRVTADDVDWYKAAYDKDELLQFDMTAVLYEGFNESFKGMITGGKKVKFFAWDPESVFFGKHKYEAQVYKKINYDYMLFNTCSAPISKFLLSRKRNATERELKEIISTIEEVRDLETQRFCA